MPLPMLSKQLPVASAKLSPTKRGLLLSRSMEKTFRRYQNRPVARRAFVEAEAVTYLAHQIRVLRSQRGWSQKDLAKKLKTTQAVVSRLEDPSYGRISFKTMIELAHAFDVAPVIMFKSTIQLMKDRWTVDRTSLEVASFAEEAELVAFNDSPSAAATVIMNLLPEQKQFAPVLTHVRQTANGVSIGAQLVEPVR